MVPVVDEEASLAVRQLLFSTISDLHIVLETGIESQRYWIEEVLRRWCDEEELDLIVTIGGTSPAPGPSTRDIVPEATQAVLERAMPGLSEAMRMHARQQSVFALLDRGTAGIRGRTLVLNLPAGGAPALLFLEAVAALIEPTLSHLLDSPATSPLASVLEIQETSPPPGALASVQLSAGTSPHASEPHGLDAAEFARYLHRKSEEEPLSDDSGEDQES
jgi:molybdenum cofactor synthesis domain-containing protein